MKTWVFGLGCFLLCIGLCGASNQIPQGQADDDQEIVSAAEVIDGGFGGDETTTSRFCDAGPPRDI